MLICGWALPAHTFSTILVFPSKAIKLHRLPIRYDYGLIAENNRILCNVVVASPSKLVPLAVRISKDKLNFAIQGNIRTCIVNQINTKSDDRIGFHDVDNGNDVDNSHKTVTRNISRNDTYAFSVLGLRGGCDNLDDFLDVSLVYETITIHIAF